MIRKIAVLTDSCCDIPPELCEKYGIDVMSFVITLDGVSYTERVDFGFDAFYKMLREAQGTPSTAHITAMQFCEKYCEYVDAGITDLLHVTINSTGSATYEAAQMAQGLLREERPEHHMRIHLIDSHTYSMVFGWPLCAAAQKLRNGAELRPVVEELERVYACSEIVLAAFSLKQMKKSGRISAAAAFAGELLGLRPIISLNQGISKVEAKVRGDSAVIPAMIRQVKSRVDDPSSLIYQIGCTDLDCTADLIKACKKEFGRPPENVFKLGAAVASNTGPDALAITYEGRPAG